MRLEEHAALGKELKRMCVFVLATAVDLSHRYGKSALVAKRASKTQKAIDVLRSVLDATVFQEHGKQHGARLHRSDPDLLQRPHNPNLTRRRNSSEVKAENALAHSGGLSASTPPLRWRN
jgi:hypothetical protein